MICSIRTDRTFGRMIGLAEGPAPRPRAMRLALPPLNRELARDLVAEVGGWGSRAALAPNAGNEALATLLVRLAGLAIELPELERLTLPLRLGDDGLTLGRLEADARPVGRERRPLFAIRPYPAHLEEQVDLGPRGRFLLRPIRPEDEPGLRSAFGRLSQEAIRQRFFGPLREMGHEMAARLTQIDYARELALVLIDQDAEAATSELPAIRGVARFVAEPDRCEAEFALIVWDEVVGRGLGRLAMQRLIRAARAEGIGRLQGRILRGNGRMLALCRHLGFAVRSDPEDTEVMLAALDLGDPAGISPPAPSR